MEKNSLLSVRNLTISFREGEKGYKRVVNPINFEIKAGETIAIVGESGSGKSVTTRAMMGLLPKATSKVEGSVTLHSATGAIELVGARDEVLRKVRGNHISMIFQEPMTALTPVLTIGEQLIEGILCHQSLSRQQAYDLATTMLKEARISEAEKRMKQYPHQLSGGMRQRVMIAMALACRPKILIADEPTTALDVTIQAQVLSLMKILQKRYNTAIVLITHDMGVVAEVADQVMVMCRGDYIESGAVTNIFSNPQHEYTKQLLAAVPKLGHGMLDNERVIDKSVEVLSAHDLCVRFDVREGLLNRVKSRVHAVEQVNLSLYSGESLALVGESGSGKSTLGRALLNLVRTHSGDIYYRGKNITNWTPRMMRVLRKDLQMIFQDPLSSLNPRKTVGCLVAEPLKLFNICPKSERKQRVISLFERVGLSADDIDRYPHQFSGGQRQRICIARALATQPRVLVADESLSALDVTVQAQIIRLLQSLQKELKISLLFISHDLAVVEQICDRVAVMYMGKIVELGETASVINNPQHPYTQKLINAVPVADPSRATLLDKPIVLTEIPSPLVAVDAVVPKYQLKAVPELNEHYISEEVA